MRALAVVLLLAVAACAFALAPPPARAAADVEFVSLDASGNFAGPVLFRARFRTDEDVRRVELIARVPGEEGGLLLVGQATESDDGFVTTVSLEGGEFPNTTYRYHFRVTTDAGEASSDERSYTVADDRFEWQTLDGEFVRLHWIEGGESFGRRAVEIGDEAVRRVSELLGVEERERIDFFVYADEEAFQEALGPSAREYVAGLALPHIRTLFGLIRPGQITSDWVDVVVGHELAHLVFDSAVKNPYRAPPHWLNEGLATYLTEDGPEARADELRDGIRRGTVVPLRALANSFPPGAERFGLGYAESVSAVDFFVRTYGQDRLIALVRSYARGLTDDEAFRAATGEDFATFDAAWQAEIGLDAPPTFGPEPAPPGATPAAWAGPFTVPSARPASPSATLGATVGPTGSAGSGPAGAAAPSAPGPADEAMPVVLLFVAGVLALVGFALLAVALRRGTAPRA